MRSHKLIGHTADIRLHVEGDTMEELFTAALEGMNGIIKVDACKNERRGSENSSSGAGIERG